MSKKNNNLGNLSAFRSQSFHSTSLRKKDFRSSRVATILPFKYLPLIPLFLVGCKKETEVKDTKVDTVTTIEKPIDSLSTILKTEKESNQNIVTVDASKMPIRLNLEIKNPDDQLILKLENLNQPKIKGYLKTEKPMNLRFNQIRMPNNTFDGPFGQTIEYDTKQKGEYWLILAKSNMADGTPVGKFFVKIE